jgi:Septum formation
MSVSARVRLALLVASVSIAVALSGCSLVGEADETVRNESGEIEEGGDLGVFAFTIGDCFNNPEEVAATGDTEGVSAVEGVPCEEPHDAQVYHLFDVPEADEFPGEEALETAGEEGCLAEFQAFVGVPYEESILFSRSLTPSADTWGDGDREIVCLLVEQNGEKLTEDHQGSGV